MKRIAIITNYNITEKAYAAIAVAERLIAHGCTVTAAVYNRERFLKMVQGRAEFLLLPIDEVYATADMIVVLGGDGTILHMAKAATRHGVPILGVNIGTMGFMAELEAGELSKLAQLAKGEYSIDKRMMLDVTVQRDRDIIYHDICLNDVVITKGAVARIVHLSVRCDGVQAMECGGDGIIIATPTGSTAYNLSAGGPIVEPEARNILITPICAHDMVSRCMVASDKRVITVGLTRNMRRNAFLSVDGGKAVRLNMGDIATVRRSEMETKLLRLKERSFYDVLNTKFKCN
jgi:NAD+ kinase